MTKKVWLAKSTTLKDWYVAASSDSLFTSDKARAKIFETEKGCADWCLDRHCKPFAYEVQVVEIH